MSRLEIKILSEYNTFYTMYDVIHMIFFFFLIKPLKHSEPKGERPTHDPSKHCHAPPVDHVNRVGITALDTHIKLRMKHSRTISKEKINFKSENYY